MLDHLTGGRLEVGTAAGTPNEMAKVGLGHDEARARNDEALDILDAALRNPVLTHHGKFWRFDNLHLTPRPVQQPAPPVWVTVVSVAPARKAARRGVKLCTGFHPLMKVVETFDAFRDEAAKAGRTVGPDDLCIRREVTMLKNDREIAGTVDAQTNSCQNGGNNRRADHRAVSRRGRQPFAATFDRSRSPGQLKEWYAEYGAGVIAPLRLAAI